MSTSDRMDRIRRAVREAAEALAEEPAPGLDRARPPTPGDLYVFDPAEDAALEWLVVREHPDDPDLLLVAPVDDFPLAGTPDEGLPQGLLRRPMMARCGETLWLPRDACPPRLRVGAITQDALSPVRRKMADLARGRASGSEDQRQADADPEYEDWIDLVQQSRELLQARTERTPTDLGQVIPFARLSPRPPAELEWDRPQALATDSGSPLLAGLNQELDAAEAEVRYHEVPSEGYGKLTLMADEDGVRGVWSGPADSSRPRLTALNHAGEPREATWEAGPRQRLYRSEPPFPWVDGQIMVEIGTDSPQRLTIQR